MIKGMNFPLQYYKQADQKQKLNFLCAQKCCSLKNSRTSNISTEKIFENQLDFLEMAKGKGGKGGKKAKNAVSIFSSFILDGQKIALSRQEKRYKIL